MDVLEDAFFIEKLKIFIEQAESDPGVLHAEQLGFFRSFLSKGGFQLPEKGEAAGEDEAAEDFENKSDSGDNSFDAVALTLDFSKEEDAIPEDDLDTSWDLKNEADELESYAAALSKLIQSLKLNPWDTGLLAARIALHFKHSKFTAALFDSEQYLKINPDSAKAHKLRGKANKALERYTEAFKDYSAANQIDYTPEVYEEIKQLQVFVDEEKEKKAKEQKERKEKVFEARKRAEEAAKKKAEEDAAAAAASGFGGMPGMGGFPGMGGMPGMGGFPGMGGMGGMPGMGGLPPDLMAKMASDPELLAAMSKPEMMAKLQGLLSGTDMSAAQDPEVLALFAKMQSAFGAGAGMPSAANAGAGAAAPAPAFEDVTDSEPAWQGSAPDDFDCD